MRGLAVLHEADQIYMGPGVPSPLEPGGQDLYLGGQRVSSSIGPQHQDTVSILDTAAGNVPARRRSARALNVRAVLTTDNKELARSINQGQASAGPLHARRPIADAPYQSA